VTNTTITDAQLALAEWDYLHGDDGALDVARAWCAQDHRAEFDVLRRVWEGKRKRWAKHADSHRARLEQELFRRALAGHTLAQLNDLAEAALAADLARATAS
jgi:hypothetical protein